MSVRVTQNMLTNTMLKNLNKSFSGMNKYQDQLSSGKKINRPSDDPVSAVRGMFYRSTVKEIEQYQRNAEDGLSWIEITDEALDQVTNALQRVRELTVQGSNGTYEPQSLKAIADEIEQLKGHIGEIANTTIGDRYIFAGTDTKIKPYDPASRQFTNTNTGEIRLEVGQGNMMKINTNGSRIFPQTLAVLDRIVADLRNGQSPGDRLAELDQQMDNVLQERALVGASMNRLEMMVSRLGRTEMTAKKLLSGAEDADMAQVITHLKEQENVHRAALAAGARIIQQTLVDFLR